ncbi:MAG: transcription termination/antitermination protein NusA [Anaerolineae bacterium]|nr:transcription termination/antitermination protein NusA [Anaerolineae bacterium]
MKSEFVIAINQICSERNLPQEVIFEAIESALVSAYKRNFGGSSTIKATIDFATGEPHVYEERIVVEQVEDERFEIALGEARRFDPEAELGALVKQEVTPRSFGRIAAQTAKQVILQRIREAERDALFTSYADREGELINGMVANITSHSITLNLGRTEAVMPRNQQVPGERYRIGQRIRAYVMEVRRSSRGPQIVVSRTHRHMLRRLLELEVPEIFSGSVEIKAIAREAGRRSKVAVAALQEGVDPVGSCVGVRGMRIQSIVGELGGEKIDVVEWNADPAKFIANALSPARVDYVVLGETDDGAKTATVVVPDDQLSLAIGKEGQNARLGAKLTSWRIDIKSASEAMHEGLSRTQYMAPPARKQRDILAMAEAILLGKEPAAEPEAPEEEAELEAVETAAELAPAEAEELVDAVTEAEALLEEEAVGEAVADLAADVSEDEEAYVAEAEQLEAELAPEEAIVEAAPEDEELVEEMAAQEAVAEAPELEPELEMEPAPRQEAQSEPQRAKRPQFRYVEDEQLDELVGGKKETHRRRRRRLVLDEETGQLISQPRHKRSGDEWEDLDI